MASIGGSGAGKTTIAKAVAQRWGTESVTIAQDSYYRDQSADFDGDGVPEVAAVVTPHIGGWLTLYRREGTRLSITYREPGFSNHAIGTDELRLAAMFDANADAEIGRAHV